MRGSPNTTIRSTGLTSMLCVSVLSGLALAAPVEGPAMSQHMFATELNEVRTGTLNGKDYLTVHINDSVGPEACHGSVLKIDSASNVGGKQVTLESIALSAMLTSESVMITVPLSWDDCVDGMPTLTDMYLLPESP